MTTAQELRTLGLAGILACAAWLAFALVPASAQETRTETRTLGFVVNDWHTAVYETKFADECPEGLSTANDEYYWRSLTKPERARFTNNGLIQAENRRDEAMHRGPEKEDVCLNPEVVKDPPMRIVEGKYSFGANLDGTDEGHATAKSCKHEKFISPLDGKTRVDNQMYRLVGCTYGWRHAGVVDENANEMRHSSGLGMILIEITGVTDPRNSDNVTVAFYRSVDQFAFDGAGKPLPFTSYRLETDVNGKVTYGDSVKGRIKDGVLTTERGDVALPFYGNYNFLHPVIKDFGLRLAIAPDGKTAKGQITGYYNADEFLYYEQGMVGHTIAGDSCPAWNVMGRQLADGYPDPKTGLCTMLSSAFDINTTAAFPVHPKGSQRTTQR